MTKYLFLLLICFASTSVYSDASLLRRLNDNIEQHTQNIADNDDAIKSYGEKLLDIERDLAGARETFVAASQAEALAKEHLKKYNTLENERRLNSATSLKTLAERKVSSRGSRKEWINNKITELQQDSKDSRKAIARNTQKIQELKTAEASRIKAQKRAQELAEKAKAEREAATKLAQAKSAATAPPAPIPTAPPATPEPEEAPEQEKQVSLSVLEQEEISYIKKRVAELKEYLDRKPSMRAKYKILKVRVVKGTELKFDHLGGEVYKAVSNLPQGKHMVNIRGALFRMTVPAEDAGKEFTIYFDNRKESRRRLLFFRTNLIQ